MNEPNRIPVFGRDGRLGWVEDDPHGEQTGDIRVRRPDGAAIWAPRSLIVQQEDGSYYLPLSSDQLQPESAAGGQASEHRVIPVLVEEAKVGRRRTTRTVRLHKRVKEHEEWVDEPGFREEVRVEHVPVNQVVEIPPPTRTEGNTLIIPVLEEVLVVEKHLVLKEEVRITRLRETIHEPQKIRLRAESVEVERSDPEVTDL